MLRRALSASTVAWRRPTMLRTLAPLASRALCTAERRTFTEPEPYKNLVAELERLSTQLPWWQTAFLRLGGTFSESNWQAAAGGDMYMRVLEGAEAPVIVGADSHAALPDRYYTRLQVRGLLCWLAHVRLRDEPKEAYATLYREMMEKVWDQATLDLSKGEFQMCALGPLRLPASSASGMPRLAHACPHVQPPATGTRLLYAGVTLRSPST
jgi:hypothetical protein